MPTFDQTAQGYRNMWAICEIAPASANVASATAHNILARMSDYQGVEKAIGVPWCMIGAIDVRESDQNPHTYLGNGDPLNRPTLHVPRGRGPFPSWMAGAIDALRYQGFDQIKDWPIERILYECEEYNGEGYESHHENSPYVWAGTNLQERGKYTSDGGFNPYAWDTQLGIAAMLKALMALDADVAKALSPVVQDVA